MFKPCLVKAKKNAGFTLLELMITLALLGILLGITIEILWGYDKGVTETVSQVIDAKMEAKSLALMQGETVKLVFSPNEIIAYIKDEPIKKFQIANGVQLISINEKNLSFGNYELFINTLGLAKDCIIKVQGKDMFQVVFIPTFGKSLIFDRDISLELIYKEYL